MSPVVLETITSFPAPVAATMPSVRPSVSAMNTPPAFAVAFSVPTSVSIASPAAAEPIAVPAVMFTVPLLATMSAPSASPTSTTAAFEVIVTALTEAFVVTSRPSVMSPPLVPAVLSEIVPPPASMTAPSSSRISSFESPSLVLVFAVTLTPPVPVAVMSPAAAKWTRSSAVIVTLPELVVPIAASTSTSEFCPSASSVTLPSSVLTPL